MSGQIVASGAVSEGEETAFSVLLNGFGFDENLSPFRDSSAGITFRYPERVREWCEALSQGGESTACAVSAFRHAFSLGENFPPFRGLLDGLNGSRMFHRVLSATAWNSLIPLDLHIRACPETRAMHIGVLADGLVHEESFARFFLEWLKDAGCMDETRGSYPLWSGLLRGLLMGMTFDREPWPWERFWRLAAKKKGFPKRFFAAPWFPEGSSALPEDVAYQLGHLFRLMPDAALKRFVPALLKGMTIKYAWKGGERRTSLEIVRLSDSNKQEALQGVIRHIDPSTERYELVRDLLDL